MQCSFYKFYANRSLMSNESEWGTKPFIPTVITIENTTSILQLFYVFSIVSHHTITYILYISMRKIEREIRSIRGQLQVVIEAACIWSYNVRAVYLYVYGFDCVGIGYRHPCDRMSWTFQREWFVERWNPYKGPQHHHHHLHRERFHHFPFGVWTDLVVLYWLVLCGPRTYPRSIEFPRY